MARYIEQSVATIEKRPTAMKRLPSTLNLPDDPVFPFPESDFLILAGSASLVIAAGLFSSIFTEDAD